MAGSDEDEDDTTQIRRPGNASADEDEDVNDTMDIDPRPGGGFEDQLAKKLVRYALSCEFSRTPIRRQGIREKGRVYPVGGSHFRRRLTRDSPRRAPARVQKGLCARSRAAEEDIWHGDETAARARKANTRGEEKR